MRKQLASAPQRVPCDAQVENEPDMATLRGPGPRPWGDQLVQAQEEASLRANWPKSSCKPRSRLRVIALFAT